MFDLAVSVDKYGRKSRTTSNDDLRRYYSLKPEGEEGMNTMQIITKCVFLQPLLWTILLASDSGIKADEPADEFEEENIDVSNDTTNMASDDLVENGMEDEAEDSDLNDEDVEVSDPDKIDEEYDPARGKVCIFNKFVWSL